MRLLKKLMMIFIALWGLSMLMGKNGAGIIELFTVGIESIMPIIIILIGIAMMIRSLFK